MIAIRIFRHQDYELQCSANAVDSGRFAPTLVVSKQVWPTRPRVIAVPRGEGITFTGYVDDSLSFLLVS